MSVSHGVLHSSTHPKLFDERKKERGLRDIEKSLAPTLHPVVVSTAPPLYTRLRFGISKGRILFSVAEQQSINPSDA